MVHTEMKAPIRCQECRRALVITGVESLADRIPEHATYGVYASAIQGSIMGASKMDNSFVVVSKQKRYLGPGLPPHSPGAAARHPVNKGDRRVEQPLCMNCTRVLSDKMDKEIEDVTAGINVYKASLQRLEQESYNILSEIDFQKEKQKEEEEKLKAAIEEAEKKSAEVTSEMKGLEAESIEFEQLKEHYWQELNSFQFQLTSQQEGDAISAKVEVSQVHLDLLKQTNVLNDAFHISHDGEIGTINNFHLGCLADVKVEWDEINAAWGQAALLLHTIAQCFTPKLYRIKIHPMGSYSRITDRNNNTYELFGRGQWFWRTQFDDGMKTFLTCLHEFAEFAMVLDKENNIPPDKIDGDKIRGHTVVRSGNTEENWTRALKYMLCDLKWVLHWFVNSTSFALPSASLHTQSPKNKG